MMGDGDDDRDADDGTCVESDDNQFQSLFCSSELGRNRDCSRNYRHFKSMATPSVDFC